MLHSSPFLGLIEGGQNLTKGIEKNQGDQVDADETLPAEAI